MSTLYLAALINSTTVNLLSTPKFLTPKLFNSSLLISLDIEYILNVALMQQYTINSMSVGDKDSNSLKSNKSNKTNFF